MLEEYPFDENNYKYIEQLKGLYSKVQIPWNSSNSTNNENLSTYDFRYRLGLIIDLLSKLKSESLNHTIGLFEFKNILKEINLLKEKDTEEFVELRRAVIILVNIYSRCFQTEKKFRELKSIKIKYNKFISTEKIEKLIKYTQDCILEISERDVNS